MKKDNRKLHHLRHLRHLDSQQRQRTDRIVVTASAVRRRQSAAAVAEVEEMFDAAVPPTSRPSDEAAVKAGEVQR